MTKKATAPTAIVRSSDPTLLGIQAALTAVAPLPPSPLDIAHNWIAYLQEILTTAERAKALGWIEVYDYCKERAAEIVKSDHVEVET